MNFAVTPSALRTEDPKDVVEVRSLESRCLQYGFGELVVSAAAFALMGIVLRAEKVIEFLEEVRTNKALHHICRNRSYQFTICVSFHALERIIQQARSQGE